MLPPKQVGIDLQSLIVTTSVEFAIDFRRQGVIIVFSPFALGCFSKYSYGTLLPVTKSTPFLGNVLDSPFRYTKNSSKFAVVVGIPKYDSIF